MSCLRRISRHACKANSETWLPTCWFRPCQLTYLSQRHKGWQQQQYLHRGDVRLCRRRQMLGPLKEAGCFETSDQRSFNIFFCVSWVVYPLQVSPADSVCRFTSPSFYSPVGPRSLIGSCDDVNTNSKNMLAPHLILTNATPSAFCYLHLFCLEIGLWGVSSEFVKSRHFDVYWYHFERSQQNRCKLRKQ